MNKLVNEVTRKKSKNEKYTKICQKSCLYIHKMLTINKQNTYSSLENWYKIRKSNFQEKSCGSLYLKIDIIS